MNSEAFRKVSGRTVPPRFGGFCKWLNYEAMREGIDDMRYIKTLKRSIDDAKSEGLTAEAQEAERLLEAIASSFDFSTFEAYAKGWRELSPTLSYWRRTSPPFDAVKSGQTTETWPEPLNFIDGHPRTCPPPHDTTPAESNFLSVTRHSRCTNPST